ncbi:E3 ubiquitin ISG15 ligase TRIM25-like [Pelobates cultripes]|uniref:E3 ubiquitin ISG15 ligase TRIM25-like n=1 Tax=Pelobates cultripes TaxID=61616 RepID=A0AAD1VQB0_PELCU|nr:E3 ubiquitin ISG15 ligase TRIM25-like [Pelobates cultripes]
MVEPTLSVETRNCSEHDKLLEYFCESDQSSICVTCYIAGSHKGHTILTLKEAWAKQNVVLSETISTLQKSEVDLCKDIEELQEALVKLKVNSENLTTSLKDLAANIISKVQNQWQCILDTIVSNEKKITSYITVFTKEREEERAKALKTIQELESVKDQPDELLFIKNVTTLLEQVKNQDMKIKTGQVRDVKIDAHTVKMIENKTDSYINHINCLLQTVQNAFATQAQSMERYIVRRLRGRA